MVLVGVAINSVKQRTVRVGFLVEGSFDEFCYPGCPRGILLWINMPILLAMVRYERCFAVKK